MSAAETKKKEFTLEEISKHNTQDSCWLIIGNLSNGAFQRSPLWARHVELRVAFLAAV
jgi:hypothetical protein